MKRISMFLLALCLSALHEAAAQGAVTPDQEYAKSIGRASAIDPMTSMGEQVNLRDGSFQLRATDIELPGTGPIIRITRTFRPRANIYVVEGLGGSFQDWTLEVPRIKTITSSTLGVHAYSPIGWQVVGTSAAQKNQRCTRFSAPPRISFPSDAARGWNAGDWWDGYYLVDDTGNDQPVMVRADATLRPDLKLMTTGNWLIGCLPATSSGEPGEAFYAISPDGTKYWFDHLVYTYAETIMKALWSTSPSGLAASSGGASAKSGKKPGPTPQIIGEFDQLERRYAAMLVTRVEDQFGNWVKYHYTSGVLDSIDASDGRHVGLTHNGTVSAITVGSGANARTWNYTYNNSEDIPHLAAVTRPDGSAWKYNLGILANAIVSDPEDPTLGCEGYVNDYDYFLQGSMTSPAGSTQTLTVNRRRFARSYVPKQCWGKSPYEINSGYLLYPKDWYSFALVSRSISGPGFATATWTYTYAPPVSSFYENCATSTSCVSTTWTDVTSPDGGRRRSIFSTRFDETENKLLREEEYSSSSQLLRATDYAYATAKAGQTNPYPWPVSVGNDQRTRVNWQTSGQWAPVRQTITTQQGRTFTNTINSFDVYARPTNVTKSTTP